MNVTFTKGTAGSYTAYKDGEIIASIEKLKNNCWRVFSRVGKFDYETLREAKAAIKSGGIAY